MSDTNVGTISIDIQLDDKQFDRALGAAETKARAAGRAIDNELSGATKRTEERFASFGAIASRALAVAGVAAGVAGLASVKMAGDFEKSLNVFQSVSGATAKQMQLVAQRARELGQDASLPGISARDAAAALTELAKAGLTVNDSLAASKGVLSLAKAGNLDVADAAATAARALNAFGLSGDKATQVADVLAAAANASSGGVSDFALALQQASASASRLKIPLADTVTALALFSNNGINGSDAGTSLKTMFANLIPTTKAQSEAMRELGLDFFDANGNFIGLQKTATLLQTKLGGLSQEQRELAINTIFGSDASRAAGILAKEGAKGFDAMSKAVNKQGAATELAAAQNKGFTGALDNFISTAQTIGTDLGTKVLPPLTEFLRVIAKELPPAMDFVTKHGHELATAVLAIGAAFVAIRLAGFISDLAGAQKSLALFIGTKNATGILAIRDGILAVGGATKTAALKVADIATAAGSAATDTSKAGGKAAAGWVVAAGRAIKAWLVAFASMVSQGAKTAVRLTVQGATAAAGWIASAVRAAAAWVAAFVTIVAKSFWAGLQTQSPATAAALAWIANAVKIAAVWTAQLAVVVARAIATAVLVSAQAVLAAAAWIVHGALVAASWIAGFVALVARAVATAVIVAAQAVVAAAAWILQPVLIAAAWIAQFAVVIARAVVAGAAIAVHAAVAGAAWVLQAGLAAGAWILRFVALIPFMLGTAIGMAAQALIVSVAWVAAAAVAAAAWIAANLVMFGVFALIVIAVVAIVAFIITHWEQVKKAVVGVWEGIKAGFSAAIEFLKKYWPLIIPIILGPIGLLISLFTQQGRDMIVGLVKGISDNAGKVVEKIKEICGQALEAVKKFFGIHSPSTVMAGVGENLMKGLAEGIAAAGSQVTSAMGQVSSDLLGALSVPEGSFSLTGDASGAIGGGAARSLTQNNVYNVYNQTDAQLIANETAWRAARAS